MERKNSIEKSLDPVKTYWLAFFSSFQELAKRFQINVPTLGLGLGHRITGITSGFCRNCEFFKLLPLG